MEDVMLYETSQVYVWGQETMQDFKYEHVLGRPTVYTTTRSSLTDEVPKEIKGSGVTTQGME